MTPPNLHRIRRNEIDERPRREWAENTFSRVLLAIG
jgi:hypothetical protein